MKEMAVFLCIAVLAVAAIIISAKAYKPMRWYVGSPHKKSVVAAMERGPDGYELNISGTGEIMDLIDKENRTNYAWLDDCVSMEYGWKINLVSVQVGDGITSLPDSSFFGCSTLASVSLPGTMQSIGKGAFASCTSLSEIDYQGNMQECMELLSNSEGWDANSVVEKVICSDGEIVISELEQGS